MWRPERWEELKKGIADESWMLPPQTEFPIVIPSGLEFQLMKSNLIEAGADTLLEALKKQTSHPQTVHDAEGKQLGILVFIEDKNE